MVTTTRTRRAAALGATLLIVVLALPGAALAAAGDLDPSFDDDGRQVLPSAGIGRTVLRQPDGKIVVAGSTANEDFGAWRFNADGSPDATFDGDGAAAVDFGYLEEGSAAALQPDGKVVVAGLIRTRTDPDAIAVVRFNADGTLDGAFDPGGADGPGKKILAGSDHQRAHDVVVQPDGRIVLTGATPGEYLIVRLDARGTPDGTVYELDGFGGLESGEEAELAPDGKLVVAGARAVARFDVNGTLDKTFGTTGSVPLPNPEYVESLLVQPDGRIVVAGGSQPADLRMVVARLTAAGDPDPAFGANGIASPDFAGQDMATGVALQDDGKLLVAGTSSAAFDFAVARLDPDGVLDPTYGSGGRTTIGFDEDAGAGDATLQADGRLVVAGATAGKSVAVARLLADPPPGDPDPDPDPDPDADPDEPLPVQLCAGTEATIVGTPGADTLRGTRGRDVIVALGGNDRVVARRGADVVCGGAGADRLNGGRGRDGLRGGPGRDGLRGGPGRDRLRGGEGRDRCHGGPARDRVRHCEQKRAGTDPRRRTS